MVGVLRKVLERGSLVACCAWVLSLCHCGGGAFTVTDQPSGSANGGGHSGGDSSSGGSILPVAGSSGSGGDVTSAGSAQGGSGAGGSGGQPSCDCPAGKYCRDGSIDCFDCSDLSRLRFSPPERIATLSDDGVGARFPRIGATNTDLIYHFDGVGMRYTTDSSTSAGSTVTSTLPDDNAPLLLREAVALSGMNEAFNFVFDRVTDGMPRSVFVGRWSNGLQTAKLAPLPFNSGLGDYSVAVALHATADGTARAFWMTKRDMLAAKLVTAVSTPDAMAVDVKLFVGKPTCKPLALPMEDTDLTPWVTSDGRTLVFSTVRLDDACLPAGQQKDIYTTLLQPDNGQPPEGTAAVPMNDVNSAADDVDPSFSADMCDLYFSSNRDEKYAVYRAHRR